MGILISGVIGVEVWIGEVIFFFLVWGFCSRYFRCWVEDVGSFGFGCGNFDGFVGDGDFGNFDMVGVGEYE